jgi:hypothetical protein
MRRLWVVVLAASACGRIGFGEVSPDGSPSPDTSLACAPGFDALVAAPLRYRFEPMPTDWVTARATCEAFGAGHALALPTTDAERLAVAAAARALVLDRWWLGGTDAAVEGTWVDTAGAPITYQPWAMFEPNNFGGGENCLDLLADPAEGAGRTDLFDDRTCTALYPFVCACAL